MHYRVHATPLHILIQTASGNVIIISTCVLFSFCSNDIVVAVQPDKPSTLICKRIVAMVSCATAVYLLSLALAQGL